jgi:hypothetical protein
MPEEFDRQKGTKMADEWQPALCECECHDKADRLPISHDIDLLCDAVTWAVERRRRTRIAPGSIQRYVRVGWVKAERLSLLMDDYGITAGEFPNRTVLVTKEQLPDVLAKLREIASREDGTDG